MTYKIAPARYAKNMMAVETPSPDGYKTRACRLADTFARGRYSGRENAYIMSKAAATKFEKHFEEGWDANIFGDKLYPPKEAL